jgi:hypothetical protein
MADNLNQRDQSGTTCRFVRVYHGPTLGWVEIPIEPELIITSAAALVLPVYASRVLLNAAVKSVTLPSVSQWMRASLPLAVTASFDASIWVKDLSYQASDGSPIVFTPNGTDKIDTFSSWSMNSPGKLVKFFPLTDLSGWYADA